ncbi:MAG TPA: type II CAAX endopeptidase family protein [Kofleriaceae bacterium]|nr:type II CAAX endopeptidase family protein [Kofleriaceae bacterium]
MSSAAEVQGVLKGLGVALVVGSAFSAVAVRSYRRGGWLGRAVARVTIDQWRAIDEDRGPGANDRPRGFDWKVAVILATVCISLTLQEYVGQRELYKAWFSDRMHTHYFQLEAFAWWVLWRVIGYVVLPVIVILLLPGERLRDYHLSPRGFFRHLWIYVVMFAMILPAVFLASHTDAFRSTYPFYAQANRSWTDLWTWEAMYAVQFMCLEFFFRGFILHGLRRALGANAIFVMIVPYNMIHYGKPMAETFGAIGAGLILGTLAMRTRSIWGGVMIHVGVAWTMDLLAVHQCPAADTGRSCPSR